ncbi:MAG: ComEC/Rec2 family competence protein [Eubacterium sp.]|nr:ComEC/Rec2 family competence protein [Eubacterium sp.]
MTTNIILHTSVIFLFITVCSRNFHPMFLLYAAMAMVFWAKWKRRHPYLARWPYYLCLGVAAAAAVIWNGYSAHIDDLQKRPFAEAHPVTAAGTVKEVVQKELSTGLLLADSYCRDGRQIINTGTILVYLDSGDPLLERKEKIYGASVQVSGVVKPFSEAGNDGAFDEKKYYTSKGVNGKIYAEEAKMSEPCRNPFLTAAAVFRQKMQEQFERFMPGREAGVIKSMLLGKKTGTDAEIKELYQEGGISHLLAISGLHVSLIGMFFYRMLLKLRCAKKAAAMISLLLIAFYVVMSGGSVSACRAGFMFAVMMLSLVWNRKYEGKTALALSAAVQLAAQPELAANLSFLYSYLAAAAILFLAAPLSRRVHGGKLADSLILSAGIQFVLLPLVMYSSYEVVWISLLLNIIVLPLAPAVLLLSLLGGSVSVILYGAAEALMFPVPYVAEAALHYFFLPVRLILKFYEMLCRWAAEVPFSSVLTGKPELSQVLAAYLLLLTALVLLLSDKKRQDCSRKRRDLNEKRQDCGKKRRLLIEKRGWILIGTAFLVLWYRPPAGFRLVMLDVGQGDGIFIETDRAHTCFIDGGSSDKKLVGKYQILPFLKSNKIGSIDYWFVSHSDSDHISGLIEILDSGYPIRFLVYAKAQQMDEKLEAAAKKSGTEILYVTAGQQFKWNDTTVSVLAPTAENGMDRNEASLVLHLKHGNFTALFGGDISSVQEEKLAQAYDLANITCFKADHHGSKNSNCEILLEKLKPQITIISAGEKNRYGHPHKEALERIRAVSNSVYMTVGQGQIEIVEKEGEYAAERR